MIASSHKKLLDGGIIKHVAKFAGDSELQQYSVHILHALYSKADSPSELFRLDSIDAYKLYIEAPGMQQVGREIPMNIMSKTFERMVFVCGLS